MYQCLQLNCFCSRTEFMFYFFAVTHLTNMLNMLMSLLVFLVCWETRMAGGPSGSVVLVFVLGGTADGPFTAQFLVQS